MGRNPLHGCARRSNGQTVNTWPPIPRIGMRGSLSNKMTWRVSRAGKVRGPFTEPEVFELMGRGKVGRGDLVSVDDSDLWFPIEEAPAFASALPAISMPYVPPPPTYYEPAPTYGYAPTVALAWSCPRCRSQLGTYLTTKTTTTGWVMFFVGLFSCVLFPLIFVGLSQKENVMFCKSCRCRL